ncbi:MAG: aminopeptidase P family protein [Chloroflexi bacterium]|nr:aminopeptidase P family protein [Chloroflexota bacterium]
MWNQNNYSKIKSYLKKNSEVDGIIIADPAFLAYATGLNLQSLSSNQSQCVLAFFSALESCLVCPKSLVSTYVNAGWGDSVLAYSDCVAPQETAVNYLVNFIKNHLKKNSAIGVIEEALPQVVADQLNRLLPEYQMIDVSEKLMKLRQIKSTFEKENLIWAAMYTDHGIAGAIHHVARSVGKTEKFLTEDIRVHVLERGAHISGYRAVAQAVSGDNARVMWPNAPFFAVGRESNFQEGKLIRLEMCGMYNGYWSNDSRMLVKSNVISDDQEAFASSLAKLRTTALTKIKPGVRANEIFEFIRAEGLKLNLNLCVEFGFGHGIGVEPVEAPFICASDETVLEENMVIVLWLSARYPSNEEIMASKDTLLITETGSRVLGWYENWDHTYTAAFTF